MLNEIFKPFYETTLLLEKDSSKYGDVVDSLISLKTSINNSTIFTPLKNDVYSIIDDVSGLYINKPLADLCALVNNVKDNIKDPDRIKSATEGIRKIASDINNEELVNEWNQFLHSPPNNLELSPLELWQSSEIGDNLSKIALSIIQLPSSTASVERSFSIQKYIHNIHRNRLSHTHVKEEMLIKFNMKVLNWKEHLENDESEESEVELLICYNKRNIYQLK